MWVFVLFFLVVFFVIAAPKRIYEGWTSYSLLEKKQCLINSTSNTLDKSFLYQTCNIFKIPGIFFFLNGGAKFVFKKKQTNKPGSGSISNKSNKRFKPTLCLYLDCTLFDMIAANLKSLVIISKMSGKLHLKCSLHMARVIFFTS